jgi:polysaccharide biosynthesis protein
MGAESVAVYAIASQIYINYMNISLAISSTLLPKITAMVTNHCSDEELQNLFLKIGRLQFYLLSLILSGFIIFGHSFLHYWVGDNFNLVYIITLLIIVPFTVDLIQNVGLAIMQARNVYHVRAVVYVLVGTLNIVLAYFLIDSYGIVGGAVATGFSMLLGNGFIMNVYYQRYMKLNIIRFWKEIFRLSLVSIVVTIVGLYIVPHIDLNKSIYILIVSMLVYTFIYFGLQRVINFNAYEKQLSDSILVKLRLKKG